MTASTRPHGRLPARVYWFRRALVVGTALALVFALARMLTGSAEPDPKANANVTSVKTTQTPAAGPLGPQPVVTAKPGATSTGTPPPVALAQPNGPCALDEITVTPVIGTLKGGGAAPLTLQLTGIQAACTFTVTADSVVAKVTTGKKRVWSSQDCPSSIKKSTVVVRSGAPTTIQVVWNGRYSDSECSRSTDWAPLGTYQAMAAVIGSEPTSAPFTLTAPPRPVITVTPKPKNKPKGKASRRPAAASGR